MAPLINFSTTPWGVYKKPIDRSGGETTTNYSSYGKPLSIQHPDGACEKFLYHYEGTLKERPTF